MKVFHCDHCGQLAFFENTACLHCGHALAYMPDLGVVGSLDAAGDGTWQSPLPRAEGWRWRLCQNYVVHNTCNWAVPASSTDPFCLSCRLTRTIPDLYTVANRTAWYKLEVAKRRLIYTLLKLQLPLTPKSLDERHGLAFEFLADPLDPSAPKVLTGHADGVITVNLAEADDAEREKRRVQMHEPYRTLLGHMRHEVGHHYWQQLIDGSPRIDAFRAMFGDERQDYGQALQSHYANGPQLDWQSRFVSGYASAHPWEDWAETWAHYLHITDTVETASACGLQLKPRRADEPSMKADPKIARTGRCEEFSALMDQWFPLTYALNNLNRGLGLPDGYPFVLSGPAVEKLEFIHDTIRLAAQSTAST